jgi:hypothetical protein
MPTKSVDDQVTRAETLFSNFVAEHNLPITVSDHNCIRNHLLINLALGFIQIG